MFIPTPNAALAVVQFGTVLGEGFSNTFWFTNPDFSLVDQTALAALLDGWASDDALAEMCPSASYIQTTVYDQRTSDGAIVINNSGAGQGIQTGELMPPSVALVVTLYTAARGRTGRGRLYMGGFGENNLQNGLWNQEQADRVIDGLSDLQIAAAAAGWTWCVVSKYQNGQARQEGLARPIIDLLVRSLRVGSQRRRNDRP